MAKVCGCDIPEDLYYEVEKHVWARPEEDLVVVGLSQVAVHLAHTIISVSMRGPGKVIRRGRSLATVESGKWVGPVPSPVEGEVVAVNDELVGHPQLLNEDPYGVGWVARVRPLAWPDDAAALVRGTEAVERYRAFLEAEGISCEGTS